MRVRPAPGPDLFARARTSRRPTRAGRRTRTGRKYFVFGYMNRNWEEELDVPVGPDNGFDHGRRRSGTADALPAAPQPLRLPRAGADRASPRRTSSSGRLTTRGKTEKAFASLAARLQDRRRRPRVGDRRARRRQQQSRGARQQAADPRGAGPEAARRRRSASRCTLVATVLDDGIPKTRAIGAGAAVEQRRIVGQRCRTLRRSRSRSRRCARAG